MYDGLPIRIFISCKRDEICYVIHHYHYSSHVGYTLLPLVEDVAKAPFQMLGILETPDASLDGALSLFRRHRPYRLSYIHVSVPDHSIVRDATLTGYISLQHPQ